MSNPFGTWDSPISAASIASGVSLRDVQWNRSGDTLVWWENRGKTGVLQAQSGMQAPRDLTDSTLNVAGRVGYGGAAFTLGAGKAFFVANGRLYSQALAGGLPRPITPKFGSYAAPAVSPRWRLAGLRSQLRTCRWTRDRGRGRRRFPAQTGLRNRLRHAADLASGRGAYCLHRLESSADALEWQRTATALVGERRQRGAHRRRYCDAGGRSRYGDLPAGVLAGRALPGLRQRCQWLGANLPLRSCGKGTHPAYR